MPIELSNSIECITFRTKVFHTLPIHNHVHQYYLKAQVVLGGNRIPATIRGGPLKDDVYELTEVVFKWGTSNCKGAEHTLNGTWFTMEAQAVHYNTRYESFEDSLDKHDGLAVCSYFLQVYQLPAWDEHPLFAKITDHLHEIAKVDSSIKISPSNEHTLSRENNEDVDEIHTFRLFELDEAGLSNPMLLHLRRIDDDLAPSRMRHLDNIPRARKDLGKSGPKFPDVAGQKKLVHQRKLSRSSKIKFSYRLLCQLIRHVYLYFVFYMHIV